MTRQWTVDSVDWMWEEHFLSELIFNTTLWMLRSLPQPVVGCSFTQRISGGIVGEHLGLAI